MGQLHASDVYSILALIASGAITPFISNIGDAIDAIYPGHGIGKALVAGFAVLVGVSALIVYIVNNKTGAPAKAVTSNVQVVPPGTSVVTATTPTVSILTPNAPAEKGP